MFTRSQYLKKECSHSEYYRQFVTPACISMTVHHIGANKIKESKDPHFNDIPLRKWDNLSETMRMNIDRKVFRECAYDTYKEQPPANVMYWSVSDGVCIAKQAARMYLEQENT